MLFPRGSGYRKKELSLGHTLKFFCITLFFLLLSTLLTSHKGLGAVGIAFILLILITSGQTNPALWNQLHFMPSFHFLCLDFLLCLSEIIRCEVTYCLKTWREKRALLCGSPAVQPFPFKGQHAQNLLSHSRPNRHSLPPCFPALTIPLFCTLFFHKLQSVRCWKLPGNCSKEPRCDKWTNSSVLAHSYPEGPWEPCSASRESASRPQRGKDNGINLMRPFPLGCSCSCR